MNTLLGKLKKHIVDNCITCGNCVKICPSIEIAELTTIKPNEIQQQLFNFVKNNTKNEIVSKRIDSCLECFKCLDCCPENINPLSFIEVAKSISFEKGDDPYINTVADDYSSHYDTINRELTEKERDCILKQSETCDTTYVFFPGCNIYKRPDILLKVKEMLNCITHDIAFIPGIKFCCGDNYLFNGRFKKAEEKYIALTEVVNDYNPDEVILWCPTCLTRIKKMWNSQLKLTSFFQFCLENIHKLNFVNFECQKKVTLHEPCKTAYTGMDLSHRNIMKNIPNIFLTEMKSGIKCCGSGGMAHFKKNTLKLITDKRLNEAVETGAEMLITVCHYCQEVFDDRNEYEELKIINLAELLYDNLKIHEKQLRPGTVLGR
ncbi:hypothetical protein CSB45_10430 [candidate division KSB3 bacterium]|uniref:4Fe-4S ferredoxin-type domain-containing protein n=1 Tax=candidate division KSB3 bacterium TaxID=2044937 RepID=A0A2G6E4F9_9BACT|nr:MAG: hypothetical protein CSB45_10430 [candidate division KSB3 bacterium]PIE29170.1 MAG: hypothetical protein CSA57_10195 [candidate division KSB3 bacterium]